MKTRKWGRLFSCLLVLTLLFSQLTYLPVKAAEAQPQSQIVMTLGADLTEEQKAYVLQYFGVGDLELKVITITNEDEKNQLGNLISADKIGNNTLSCALVKLTGAGGIQVKTANMNYVTSNMIASTLSTSGVYNCEVLTAAPFEVSGTGALTGVMMAYESASGNTLDPEKKALANEELVITGQIADTVGQDHATLVVNDIKIHIVRDQITDDQEVNAVVDEVIATTEEAAQKVAEVRGKEAPAKLGEVEHEKLYNFGHKFSKMGYKYKDMQHTLERVTRNVTKSTGIDDPITDTFTTTDEDSALSLDSILLNTDDNVLGEDAIINATNNVAIGDCPPEPIEVFSGDAKLTEAGGIKAKRFISNSNTIAYEDVNGSHALIDLNGNILTESLYTEGFKGAFGYIAATLDDGSNLQGLLGSDGSIAVPFQYDLISPINEKWAIGIMLTAGTEEDYDYSTYVGKYQIETADIYYLGNDGGALVGTLTRDQIKDVYASGDYLNIEDRSEIVTTYDPAFAPLQNPEYLSDFGNYNEDRMLIDALSDRTGYSVYNFKGNYAKIHDVKSNKFGIMDRYGNIIVPVEFDRIDSSYIDSYMAGGYFGAKIDNNFAYVTAGGTVTGSFAYPYDEVQNYGMSAKYENAEGNIILLSGDGKETNLGTEYDYVTVIRESKGMFWKCEKDSKYDLIDWHGNVLATGSSDYSMSANGNYLIAQNGYTSSTLYLVNDASEVSITESLGGASELELTIEEGASLETYTGDPKVELVGDILGTAFVAPTHMVVATNDGDNYALMDLNGKQLTNPIYSRYFSYTKGWLVSEVKGAETSHYGLVSTEGAEIIPPEYDLIEVLNENWVAAFTGTPNGTEDDYDYHGYDKNNTKIYYQIDQAVIYHISSEELSSVTLTRDQIADVEAEDDYLNIQDRTSGTITTYDSTFTAVATVDSVNDFKEFSKTRVLYKTLEDSTGLTVSDYDFPDGYTRASDYSKEPVLTGVIDMNGTLVIPTEYHHVILNYQRSYNTLWAYGYFAVEKDGMAGYVKKDGEVTCELKYPVDSFNNGGLAAAVKNEDGTYTLVAADGTETTGFDTLRGFGRGKFWQANVGNTYSLIDWHGNVIFEDVYDVEVSEDDQFIIVQKSYNEKPQLYAVDGATVESVTGNTAVAPAAEPETDTKETESSTDSDEKMEEQTTEESSNQTETAESNPAMNLLNSAKNLAEADATANADSILVLLEQAKTALESESPEAATLIDSAITLMKSGAADSDSISTLIDTALGML